MGKKMPKWMKQQIDDMPKKSIEHLLDDLEEIPSDEMDVYGHDHAVWGAAFSALKDKIVSLQSALTAAQAERDLLEHYKRDHEKAVRACKLTHCKDGPANTIQQLHAELLDSRADAEALRGVLRELLELCDHANAGAWHNGVEHCGMDEGDFAAMERIERARQALSTPSPAASRNHPWEQLRKQAIDALNAIKALPEDALGRDPREGHYYRDELIDGLSKAIADSHKDFPSPASGEVERLRERIRELEGDSEGDLYRPGDLAPHQQGGSRE